ncbi:mCG145965, partial [Mus musculus]
RHRSTSAQTDANCQPPPAVSREGCAASRAHLSWWMIRLMASNSTAFLAFECWTFLDLGGSWALFRMVSKHSVRRPRTAGSSGQDTTVGWAPRPSSHQPSPTPGQEAPETLPVLWVPLTIIPSCR